MRALANILEFYLEINYLPGAKNYFENVLSQRPDYKKPPIPSNMINNVKLSDLSIFLLKLTNNEE
jgi:hypothetical protein